MGSNEGKKVGAVVGDVVGSHEGALLGFAVIRRDGTAVGRGDGGVEGGTLGAFDW